MKIKAKKLRQKKIESAKKNFWSLLFLISVFVGFFGLVGLMASEKDDTNASSEQTEQIHYFHNDHLGTSIKLTDQAGNVVWERQDGPFGEEPLMMKPNSITMNLRFPGQYYDEETGLNYNMGRYYNPKLGRYMTPDPVGGSPNNPQSFNQYPYVENNPINYVDPLGLTLKTNWEFFWDWVLEKGQSEREYGEGTIEIEEMKTSPGAAKMREEYKAKRCSYAEGNFGTVEAYFKTIWMPNSTAFQVGGFYYNAVNNGDGTVTYTIRNQASAYSFFLHIPGIPHAPRGGTLHLFGNIDQLFSWTEKSPCCGG